MFLDMAVHLTIISLQFSTIFYHICDELTTVVNQVLLV